MADKNNQPQFSLYHTLKKSASISLSSNRRNKLIADIKGKMNTLDERESEAVVGLVCEHASFVDGWTTSLDSISFPYECKYTSATFEMNLDLFPDGLLQTIKEFLRISSDRTTKN